MSMADYEPGSGCNLPPGCFEGDPKAPWNQKEPRTCGECCHLLEGCCDFGTCELELWEAFAARQAEGRMATWEAVLWARKWIADNYKDMQEDVCPKWEEWRK